MLSFSILHGKTKKVLFFLILFITLALVASFVTIPAGAEVAYERYEPCQSYESAGEEPCTIMHPSPETLRRWVEAYNNAPTAPLDMKTLQIPSPSGSLSLLDRLQYTPSERNQGFCGNCWAWAGTGVMEIALDVQNGINDRLSIQYLNSNYNGGGGSNWACCGGWLANVEGFYTGTGQAIPWSNTNAYWQDGGRTCDSGSTTVPAGNISTTPYYPITSIQEQTITTYDPVDPVTQATAIANIKNILDQNKAVWFAYFLATGADWDNFRSFWNGEPESTIWNTDFSCGHEWDNGGGHAVLCVGYNDEAGTDNDYWVMLNSWGTAGGGRPNGLFRLDMNMNYDCYFYDPIPDGYYSFYWQTLDITYSLPSPAINIVSKTSDDAVGNIIFPPGAPSATVSNPYNNVDGTGDPQVLSASVSEPVVRLKNTSGGTLNVRLEITSWTNGVVVSEDSELVNTGTGNVAVVDDVLSADGGAASVDTTVTIDAVAYKALYLEVTLSALAGKSGTSTLTILGEMP